MRRWPFVALFCGLALQITVWILVIPPYSTYDEFDHVYRASSVWHGHVRAVADPPKEYPGAVYADRALVEGGVAECMRLPYTSTTRCRPGPEGPDGTVLVTSGAALYNPLFYALVSPATRLGHGWTTVIWMRAWSALLTACVIGWALVLGSRWSRPDAALRGVILGFSPIVAISMAVVAPNGLEMACGLLWWISLLTVTEGKETRGRNWVPLVVSGCLLALLRSLGPVILVVSASIVLLWRWPTARASLKREPWRWSAAAAAISAAVLTSAFWVLSQHARAFETEEAYPSVTFLEGAAKAFRVLPVSIIQFIAAIPGRDIAPPLIVPAAWLVPFVLLVLSVSPRHRRGCAALLTLTAFVLLFPLVFEGFTYHYFGLAWQSRYLLPLAFGIPLIAALSGTLIASRLRTNDLVALVATTTAHTVTVWFALDWYARYSPMNRVYHVYPLVSPWLAIALSAAAGVTCGTALLAWQGQREAAPVEGQTKPAVSSPI